MMSPKFCKTSLTLTTLTVVSLAVSQPASAASRYSITDLGTLLESSYSYAYDINNQGQVVLNSGFGSSNGSASRAFVYKDNQFMEISPLPGDTDISVNGINNLGQVVGNSSNDKNYSGVSPFIYSNGTKQSLGLDGIAYAINDSGQVVGGTTGGGIFPELAFPYGAAFLYSGGKTTIINNNLEENYVAYGMNNLSQVVGIFGSPERAFLYDNSRITNLGTLPGDNYSSASGINDLGQVVGVSAKSGVDDGTAFLYSSSKGLTDLGILDGDNYSIAFDINNLGQVVGTSASNPNFFSENGDGVNAFLYSDGKMQDLNKLIPSSSGFKITQARAINDSGQIVGAGSINGELHAYLLTPQSSTSVPEPFTLGGTAVAGILGWWMKRKKINSQSA